MGKKKTDFDFHCDNIKKIKKISDNLIEIVGELDKVIDYSRADEKGKGWWMIIKEIAIRHYISVYLLILKTRPQNTLVFIDLLSASGFVRLSDNAGHEFSIAGSSMIAAGMSIVKNNAGFDHILLNDGDPKRRKLLAERFSKIQKKCDDEGHSCFEYEIDTSTKIMDSNSYIDEIITYMESISGQIHYLAVIDNEGMNITFETLKKLRTWEKGNYGDLIIHYPNVSIDRQCRNLSKVNAFFGKDMADISKDEWMDVYIRQLKSIGIKHVETLEVHTGKSRYFYTLLFCVRKVEEKAPWMKMIARYRNDRFKNFSGQDVKKFWGIVHGPQKTIKDFF